MSLLPSSRQLLRSPPRPFGLHRLRLCLTLGISGQFVLFERTHGVFVVCTRRLHPQIEAAVGGVDRVRHHSVRSRPARESEGGGACWCLLLGHLCEVL